MNLKDGPKTSGESAWRLANPTLEICQGGNAGLSFYHVKHRVVVLCGSCVFRHMRFAAQFSQS